MVCVHVVSEGSLAVPGGATDDFGIFLLPGEVVVGTEAYPTIGADLDSLLEAARGASSRLEWRTPTVEAFRSTFERLLGWGVEIVSLHAADGQGGAAGAAQEAATSLGTGVPITVVRTCWSSGALGLLAVRLAALGQDETPRAVLAELATWVGGAISFTAIADGPDALARGGVHSEGGEAHDEGGEAHDEGGRPVLELVEGEWRLGGWVADAGEGLRRLAQGVASVASGVESPLHVAVTSAGADAEAAALATFLESRVSPDELWIAHADTGAAAVLGPGGFGVAVYADE